MFRVGKILPISVVVPVPWFPLQGLIRLWHPDYRPMPPMHEVQAGIDVWYPRFFSFPGLLRSWDGFFMAVSCFRIMRRLKRDFVYDIIDAHFAYPDGYAATLLGKWLMRPVTITLRGTEVPHSRNPAKRKRILTALARASRVFSVANALKEHVVGLGADSTKIQVVGNGVDISKFCPEQREVARSRLGIDQNASVLITVGGLVERKGFHRVIECLPDLLSEFPNLVYLIVGGPSKEGDWSARLQAQVAELGLEKHVHFLGTITPEELRWPLSAADVFVLATSNEGWANVFLEAMACGLPVVTTDVGGNSEVVQGEGLGIVLPFGNRDALFQGMRNALAKTWNRSGIIAYARENSWNTRVQILVEQFRQVVSSAL
jgi:glycosyltransferase involved in cell wall biosynthesis